MKQEFSITISQQQKTTSSKVLFFPEPHIWQQSIQLLDYLINQLCKNTTDRMENTTPTPVYSDCSNREVANAPLKLAAYKTVLIFAVRSVYIWKLMR